MKKPNITREKIKTLLDRKFVRVYDIQYEEGKHYYDASRNKAEDLAALKTDEEFRNMLPDAVTVFVVIEEENREPRLLLDYEYRYPTGRFLLSPTAGLLDPEDKKSEEPLYAGAKREIFEETGIVCGDNCRFLTVSPLVFSTPGMTDESNAMVCAVISLKDLSCLSQEGAEGTECFDGFLPVTVSEAKEILRTGRDPRGNFYSLYTWAALMYFVSGAWKE